VGTHLWRFFRDGGDRRLAHDGRVVAPTFGSDDNPRWWSFDIKVKQNRGVATPLEACRGVN
jgi:hypothetical protein